MKTKKSRQGIMVFVIIVSLAVLGGLALYYRHMKKQQMQQAVQTPTTETEKLIAKDLEMGYPETPKETIKLFGRINQCIYNKELTEEEFPALVKQLRVLYCEELKKINTESKLEESVKQSVEEYRAVNRKIVNYTIDEERNYEYTTIDGVEAVCVKFSTFMRESDKYSTWNQYAILIKEKDKWKIREFGSMPSSDTESKSKED